MPLLLLATDGNTHSRGTKPGGRIRAYFVMDCINVIAAGRRHPVRGQHTAGEGRNLAVKSQVAVSNPGVHGFSDKLQCYSQLPRLTHTSLCSCFNLQALQCHIRTNYYSPLSHSLNFERIEACEVFTDRLPAALLPQDNKQSLGPDKNPTSLPWYLGTRAF